MKQDPLLETKSLSLAPAGRLPQTRCNPENQDHSAFQFGEIFGPAASPTNQLIDLHPNPEGARSHFRFRGVCSGISFSRNDAVEKRPPIGK